MTNNVEDAHKRVVSQNSMSFYGQPLEEVVGWDGVRRGEGITRI